MKTLIKFQATDAFASVYLSLYEMKHKYRIQLDVFRLATHPTILDFPKSSNGKIPIAVVRELLKQKKEFNRLIENFRVPFPATIVYRHVYTMKRAGDIAHKDGIILEERVSGGRGVLETDYNFRPYHPERRTASISYHKNLKSLNNIFDRHLKSGALEKAINNALDHQKLKRAFTKLRHSAASFVR